MHAGSINNQRTAAHRVHQALIAARGEWRSSWALTVACRTTAIGTRVSEVRAQLPPTQRLERSARPTLAHERGSWYRLVEVTP